MGVFVRDEKLINNEGAETTTPYYPQEKILPQRIRLNNSETSINTRTAKWGLYQSSHDKTQLCGIVTVVGLETHISDNSDSLLTTQYDL